MTDDTIMDLKDRLLGTQQTKDAEKEQYEQKLQQLRNEFQNMKDQLTSENMILGKYILFVVAIVVIIIICFITLLLNCSSLIRQVVLYFMPGLSNTFSQNFSG